MMDMTKTLLPVLAAAFGALSAAADVPRPEYPRPQFVRDSFVNLNGTWTFDFDFGQSGQHAGRDLHRAKGFSRKIVVPFCPESSLSGVGYKDFIPAMWYHRALTIPSAWAGKRVLLNFGGVDYEAEIFIDGTSVGYHAGGSSSFTVDLTSYVKAGATYNLVVRVKDDMSAGNQTIGKQCTRFKSAGCSYTRTTGIWQTVWMEAVDRAGLASCRIVPDFDNSAFVFTPTFWSDNAKRLKITVKTADGTVDGTLSCAAASGVAIRLPLKDVRPWAPGTPHLYDIVYEVFDAAGRTVDTVRSYAGLRKVSTVGGRICLNNRPVYLRLVLDQGFYPDGIWTAPTDAALKRDIELSMAAGFNGARLHQKVFEERFHYWADRLGYLTWGEMSSWGADPCNPLAARNFIPEWCEIVRRDLNHPSIIAWTPFNETWNRSDALHHQRTQNDVYELTRAIDPTRPVNSSSGEIHAKTDLWTIHNYSRAPRLKEIDTPAGTVWTRDRSYARLPYTRYDGQPYLIDEFGGLGWIGPDRRKAADNTWGYGRSIKTEAEFFDILKKEVEVILSAKNICGYCYTQLTDVEQEQNGVYYYDRVPKFDPAKFKAIFGVDPYAAPSGK
jgi:beta-galactosidase/beta-glucuronidase